MDPSEKHHHHHHNRFTKTLTRLVNQPKFELHLRVTLPPPPGSVPSHQVRL